MKLNKKGYLVVELVVSFAISLTVTLFLLATIFDLKNKSDVLALETTMLTNQAVITKEIQDDIALKTLTEIEKLDDCQYCYELTYEGEEPKILEININNRTIEYGTESRPFKKRLPSDAEFGNISIRIEKITSEDIYNNCILFINIPIINTVNDNNYDIKAMYQYNDSSADVLKNVDSKVEFINYTT